MAWLVYIVCCREQSRKAHPEWKKDHERVVIFISKTTFSRPMQEKKSLEQAVIEPKKSLIITEKDRLNAHSFNLHFNKELKKSSALKKKVNEREYLTLVIYVKVTTNSLTASLSERLFDKYLAPAITKHNYDSETIEKIKGAFGELYPNAVLHGNQGGYPDEYKRKNRKPPQELEQNQKKKVTIELAACSEFVLLRVTDEGKGLENSEQRCEQAPDPKSSSGRGLLLIRNYYRINELLFCTATNGFGVSIIQYKRDGLEKNSREQ